MASSAHRMKAALLLAFCCGGLAVAMCEAPGTLQSCTARINIANSWAARNHYLASMNVAIENTGSQSWPAGMYNITMDNAYLVDLQNAWGWNSSTPTGGSVSGTLMLSHGLAPTGQVDFGATVITSFPGHFYPTQIMVDCRQCKLQQDPDQTSGRKLMSPLV